MSRGRAEEDQTSALIQQDGLVKHLEKLRARLVNGDEDDLVVRHPPDDLDNVFGIFRRKAAKSVHRRGKHRPS